MDSNASEMSVDKSNEETRRYPPRRTRNNNPISDFTKQCNFVPPVSLQNKSSPEKSHDPRPMCSKDWDEEDHSNEEPISIDFNCDEGEHLRSDLKVGQGYWSPEQRALLFAAVMKHGMLDIAKLAKIVEKSKEEVKIFLHNGATTIHADNLKTAKINALKKVSTLLFSQDNIFDLEEEKGKKNPIKAPAINLELWDEAVQSKLGNGPIEWWLTRMETDTRAYYRNSQLSVGDRKMRNQARSIGDMLPRALQVIARYEKHPEPSECAGVNYRDAYEFLAHMMHGVPGKILDPPTAKFIRRSVRRLQLAMIDALHSPGLKHHLGAQLHHMWKISTRVGKFTKRSYGTMQKQHQPATCLPSTASLLTPEESFERLSTIPTFNLYKVPNYLLQPLPDIPVESEEDFDDPFLLEEPVTLPTCDTYTGIFADLDTDP